MTNDNKKNDNSVPTTITRVYKYINNDTKRGAITTTTISNRNNDNIDNTNTNYDTNIDTKTINISNNYTMNIAIVIVVVLIIVIVIFSIYSIVIFKISIVMHDIRIHTHHLLYYRNRQSMTILLLSFKETMIVGIPNKRSSDILLFLQIEQMENMNMRRRRRMS